MELTVSLKADDGRTVVMAAQQANAIQELNNTRKAGIASVTGYKPTTNWITPPTQNIQLIAHISIENLYKRKLESLQGVQFKDMIDIIPKNDVLKDMPLATLKDIFEARKATQIKSLEGSLDGTLDNAHTQAHNVCYARFGSVKVHLVTEDKPNTDGKKGTHKEPVVNADGSVTLNSIMVQYIELNVTTIVEGERKPPTKSGAPVVMGKLIERVVDKRSTVLKTLSLKADNFESFKIDGKELVAEDVSRFGNFLKAYVDELYRTI